MVLDLILGTVFGFVLIVVGSYIGAKMALNTFFGRDYDPDETGRDVSAEAGSDDVNE